MTLEKDTLHVVIRLPFKRPQGFVGPPPILWTDEMEQRLRQYMSQKHKDWNYIAEQLGVPSSYLVRHAAFIYETQLREIQQRLRLSDTNKSSPVSHRKIVSTTTLPNSRQSEQSRRQASWLYKHIYLIRAGWAKHINYMLAPPPRNDETMEPMTAVDGRTKSQEDAMMFSAISNVAPRIPLQHQQQQEEESDISSIIEESLYRSFQSSRGFYSPEGSVSRNQNKHLRQIDQDNPCSMFSLGSSDSSITQSALEDAFLSRMNNGSKMSSLAFSKR
ncbi:hypothetical protein BX666DRAFT_374067 [Dichotomocladium elegans]|nr:hypothetical protein BX666DRAFT_374067 [Dichotomocladium elegans]